MSTNDKIIYNVTRTIKTADFENVIINYGYESVVGSKESPEQARKRVTEHVEDFMESAEEKIREQLED